MFLSRIINPLKKLRKTIIAFSIILIVAVLLEVVLMGMLVRKNAANAVNLLLNQVEIFLKENTQNDISRVINNIPTTKGFEIYIVDLRDLKLAATTNKHIEDQNLANSFRKKMNEKLKSAGKGIVFHKGDFYYIDFRRNGFYVAASSYCLTNSYGHIIIPIVTISVYLTIAGLFILRLILNLYQTNEKLNSARKTAEDANNAKTKFLNNMSHDIRTPMNAILGFANLIENKKYDSEIVSEYVKKIEVSGNYLLSLINNVLEMARIESGKIELSLGPVDLSDKNDSVLTIFENELNKKHLQFKYINEIKHKNVLADKSKILQIIVNLLSNAIKYTPEGGTITLSATEFPSTKEGYAFYVCTVQDTGIGISSDFKNHIFESFTREHSSTESRVSGTGLGMSIVKKLVDIMNGQITVESESGKGSRFSVTLELKQIDSENQQQLSTENFIKNEFSGHSILLVEDNDLNAEIATEILKTLGIEVERAVNGIDCLQKLKDSNAGNKYDLILMDIQMPGMDGYETTRRIRSQEQKTISELPVIAMTANAFEEDKKLALQAGMNSHLVKPIELPALISCLRQML